MSADGQQILQHLETVGRERARRGANAGLAQRVDSVKRYQHARFAQTYADLTQNADTAGAVSFFLEELYGPGDFTHRDAQFARIVPALVRLFPREIVGTVRALAELHALSEQLDSAMGSELSSPALDDDLYRRAWLAVGRPEQREEQIALMLSVGHALDRYTRNPLLRHSLRLMRGPAQAAGLSALQRFLERGFDTFRALRHPAGFLNLVAERERRLVATLFTTGGQ